MASSAPNRPGRRRRVLLLLNPGAGQSAALQHAQRRVEEHPGLDVDLLVPDPSDQQAQFSQAQAAVRQGVDVVVVCGGDGMVSLGVALVSEPGVPLGIIPAGSGNDFARAAGIPRRFDAALQRLLDQLSRPKWDLRPVDALRLQVSSGGVVDRRWAANSVNIGFDARVNQRANTARRTPRQLRYLAALAQEVPRFGTAEFDVEMDGLRCQRLDSALVCIQNGSTIGGGIPLAPHARIDDGWAEISHVGPLSRGGLMVLFPLLMARMHRWLTPLTTRRARWVRVRVPAGVPIFADGDEVHSGAAPQAEGVELEVELVPGAVQLLS